MKRFFALFCGLALALSGVSEARDFKVRRDLDGDGHFNTKRIDVSHHGYGGYGGHGYGGHYRGGYYRGGGYYGGGYGYGYGFPYYGYGFGYPYEYGPGVSFSYSPGYAAPREYSDDLSYDVQRELKRRGYYRGTLDGDIGPGTRAAIRSYQAQRRLPVTGRIDRDLVRDLDLD